ncbi:hypothetical protein [Cardinium endosymbiont of Philonthus spinipes]|uniref:hypothetical protein n=1 Tax=Cardinium endosymbiont of Philonthus spinipes TaxID=3077941 RepID=UPI00313B37A4
MVACALYSCQQSYRTEMGSRFAKQACPDINFLETEVGHDLPKCVIVALHGLNMDASEMDEITKAAKEELGENIEIMQPKCREGWVSVRLSIDKQAKKVVEEIKEALRDRYPQYSEEEHSAIPINLFGYSQGGLVACILAAKYRDILNISTIICALTPLNGTQIFENNKSNLDKFNKKAAPGLQAIGHPKTSLIQPKILGTILNTPVIKTASHAVFQGIRDMCKGSKCIADVTTFIRNDKHDTPIPILLIGSSIPNLAEYFAYDEQKDQAKVDALTTALSELITGRTYGEHDFLIDTGSQLCRGTSFENLATSKDDAVYHSNVEIHIAEGLFHCCNFTAILSDFEVHYNCKSVFDSKETIAVMMQFLKQHNG